MQIFSFLYTVISLSAYKPEANMWSLFVHLSFSLWQWTISPTEYAIATRKLNRAGYENPL